jgi:hypothetical protein
VSRFVSVIAIGSALSWSGAARADCASKSGLSTCIEADTFWPHAGSAYFNFVGGTRTTAPGRVGFGMVTTYLARPIVLIVPTADPNGAEVNAVGHLWDNTFLFSLGLLDRLEATVAIPVALYRVGTGVSSLTSQKAEEISRGAMRDTRIGAAYTVLAQRQAPEADGFGLTARLQLALPTGDESSFAGDRSVVAIPSVAGDWQKDRFTLGAELGARIRKTSELSGSRVGPQLAFAWGAGVELLSGRLLGVLIEATLLPTLVAQHELALVPGSDERVVSGSRRLLMPVEWLASLRTAELLSGDMSVNLGGGSSLPVTGEAGITAPSYRLVLSVRYAPHVRTTPRE